MNMVKHCTIEKTVQTLVYGKLMLNCQILTDYVLSTQCKGIFNGNVKYPLPTRKATDNRIGKGGNGFVLILF